ncbi:MAG: hypothetical protein F6J87_20500 [Spirulina sp. SIO3F2]|nr:hypothetical protein [Spirulina sp. SIO3F2]
MSQHRVEQQTEQVIEVPDNLTAIPEPDTSAIQTGDTVLIIGSVCVLLKLLTELVKACKS